MKLFLPGLIPVLLLICSCSSHEIRSLKDVDPDSIYFDYRVWGDEEAGYITVRLQYLFVGPEGPTLLLMDPSKAELDGAALKPDSSRRNGVYYEITKPIAEFTGHHSIVFTDKNKKQYREDFDFQPFRLQTTLPAVVGLHDLAFDLDGLAPEDHVKVLFSDTATFSRGIERVDTVKNGRIVVKRDDLQVLLNGPVTLILSKEEEQPINNGTRERGKLQVSYEVKRQFELRDSTNKIR